ncbi:MAG: stage III sporulation protein AF [Bacillota bacterium]
MDAIYQWARTVAMVVLFAAMVELLSPSEAMARYLRLVLGLVVVLAVMSPALTFLDRQWGPDRLLTLMPAAAAAEVARTVETSLTRQAEVLVGSVDGLSHVQCRVDLGPDLRPVRISVRADAAVADLAGTARAIAATLAAYHGISEHQVEVNLAPARGRDGR